MRKILFDHRRPECHVIKVLYPGTPALLALSDARKKMIKHYKHEKKVAAILSKTAVNSS